MAQEVERKFLVKNMPNLTGMRAVPYERHILSSTPLETSRVQIKDGVYEYERKSKLSDVESQKTKEIITKEKFEEYKARAIGRIERESYLLESNPQVTLKIYHGQHEGLVRAEVEFENSEEAKAYVPPEWMGKEITGTPLESDGELALLNRDSFKQILERLQG